MEDLVKIILFPAARAFDIIDFCHLSSPSIHAQQFAEKLFFRRLLKNVQMQGAPACGRQAKSRVGNGFKPFPTVYAATTKGEGNAADACLR
jgi:hypothetical protein